MANGNENVTAPLASGWWTSEFGMALIAIAGNVIGLLVLLKLIPPGDQTNWTERITAIISLLGVIFGNTTASVKFIHSRQKLKETAINNQAILAAERMNTERADRQAKEAGPKTNEPRTTLRVGQPGWANEGM